MTNLKTGTFVFMLAGLMTMPALGETLRLAHGTPETDPLHLMSVQFKEEVEAKTNGEITVEIFPQSQLGNDQQMIDGVRSGIIDIEMSGLNNFTGLIPEAAAFTLPFIFPDRDAAYAALDGEVGQDMANSFREFGLEPLGFPENGFRNMTNNRGPIAKPEDLAGLRMRVNNSSALNQMFNILKANPQQIPVAELYTALETGVVDAQDHPISVVQSFRFYEVQEYLSLTQHAYSTMFWVMNGKKFDQLTEDQQQIIKDAAAGAVDAQRKAARDGEEAIIAQLESEGLQVNRDVDSAAFQEIVKPVWEEFAAEHGDGMINRILETQK